MTIFTPEHKKIAVEVVAGVLLSALLGYVLHHINKSAAAASPAPQPTVGQLLGGDIQGLTGATPAAPVTVVSGAATIAALRQRVALWRRRYEVKA